MGKWQAADHGQLHPRTFVPPPLISHTLSDGEKAMRFLIFFNGDVDRVCVVVRSTILYIATYLGTFTARL